MYPTAECMCECVGRANKNCCENVHAERTVKSDGRKNKMNEKMFCVHDKRPK